MGQDPAWKISCQIREEGRLKRNFKKSVALIKEAFQFWNSVILYIFCSK